MGKILFLLLLGIVVWWALRAMWRAKKGDGRGAANEPAASAAAPEDMVRCVQCGVHLPRSESLLRGGRLFCSEEHVRLTE